jgi:uncharacterized protein YaeQ
MALKSTIFKADLQIADMDRHYYQDHQLTIARHPSETDERMMVRLLAFIFNARDSLSFGKGLSADDEPDLWDKDFTGAIRLWIEVGQPDERRILKACGRSAHVLVYSYGKTSSIWWNQIGSRVARAKNLSVFTLDQECTLEIAQMAQQRSMQMQCTIQDGQLWVTCENKTIQVRPVVLHEPEIPITDIDAA